MKICGKCKIEKDFDQFHKKGKGYNHICKVCRKEYIKDHYEKNKDAYKSRSKSWKENNPHRVIATRYGVDEDVVKEIMSVGKCQICSSTENLVFDHVHKTSEPRGCLCHSCNTMLGRLGDTEEQIFKRMEAIKSYLTHPKQWGIQEQSCTVRVPQ